MALLTAAVALGFAGEVAGSAELWQEPRFVRLGPEDGLSHNSVLAVLQDSRGFMWFGTQDGLDRWDGYEIRAWKHIRDDPSSLASSWIQTLLEDETGALWVGTNRGLNRLSSDRTRIERFRFPEDGEISVNALSRSATGGIWVGTSAGLFRAEPRSGEIGAINIAPLQVPIRQVRESVDGDVWLLTAGESEAILLRFNTERGAVTRYPLNSRAHTFELLGGRSVWLGEVGATLEIHERPRPLRASFDETGPPRALAAAGNGTLWSGNLHGLAALTTDGSVHRLRTVVTDEATLANEVRSLYVDRTGTVWAGTHGGVFRYDPNRKPVLHLTRTAGRPDSLHSAAVSNIVEGPSGVLWVGTFGGGLSRVEPATGRVTTLRAPPAGPLCGDNIWGLAPDAGRRLWVVSEDGICSVDLETGAARSPRLDKPETSIFALALHGEQEAWLGGYHAVYSIDLRTGSWKRSPFGAPELTDTQVIRKLNGSYWFGTNSGTLAGFDDATGAWTVLEGLADGPITDVEINGHGGLWLATGAGLASLDLETRTLTHVRPDPPWPGSVVYTVTADLGGDLWLGTNKGLGRYSPGASGAARFAHYDLSDGIGNLEFNRKAKLRTSDGLMILGGMNGLTIFRPEAMQSNPHAPSVVLTDVAVLGGRGEDRYGAFPLECLVVHPSALSVTFQFSALSFTNPRKNRYAYWMDGLEQDWVEAGTLRSARYTSIPPGEYVFRVKASNNDGVWNEAGLALPVSVLPPFWQTWWFRLLAALAIASLLYTWHRFRVRRLLEMEGIRLRIASDLHDELSGELSSIALSSAIARRSGYLEEPERRRLAEIESTSRQVVGGLRDIVWYINPEHDTLPAMVRRMRSTAAQLLGEIEYVFEDGWTAEDVALEMTARRDLYLIYKETLNNVTRHARAARVQIRLTEDNGRLGLVVKDDGVGFDPASAAEGNGLANMERRAERLGALLVIESEKNAGTTVRLDYPLTRTRGGGGRPDLLG